LQLRRILILTNVLCLLSLLVTPAARANEKPTIESFTTSKSELDLSDSDLNLVFEIVASHPSGIENKFTNLTLTNGKSFSTSIPLVRNDLPINFSNKVVTFRGNLVVPRNFNAGVYTYSIEGVTSGTSKIESSSSLAISKVDTGVIPGPVLRSTKGAESGIIIRNSGYLDLNYQTLNGPAYGPQSGLSYINSEKYSNVTAPIWKVGEVINLSDYFELAVSGVEMTVATNSPKVCTANGVKLKLISIGDCSFSVATPRNKDYLPKTVNQSQYISEARKSTTLFIEKIPNQSVKNLPINLELPKVYASGVSSVEYIFPISSTPEICQVAGYILKIFSGGTCLLTYQSLGNTSFSPSAVYTQFITIEKINQTIDFDLVKRVKLNNRTVQLNARSSSGGPITFTSNTKDICEVDGSILSLLSTGNCSINASQIGSPIYEQVQNDYEIVIEKSLPINKKSKVCPTKIELKIIKKANPDCPKNTRTKQK
jgi:hypothetical protein